MALVDSFFVFFSACTRGVRALRVPFISRTKN